MSPTPLGSSSFQYENALRRAHHSAYLHRFPTWPMRLIALWTALGGAGVEAPFLLLSYQGFLCLTLCFCASSYLGGEILPHDPTLSSAAKKSS